MKDKLKILFLPYFLISLGLILGYTFLHWLFLIHLQWFSLKKELVEIIIPMVLAGIVSWLYIRPKLKILNLDSVQGSWKDFYCFLLWLILLAPAIISQLYMVKASGQLTRLNSIKEITTTKPGRYYSVQQFYIDKEQARIHYDFKVGGKRRDRFVMHTYVVLPMFEKESEKDSVEPYAWYALDYTKLISNSLDRETKEEKFREFVQKCKATIQKKKPYGFTYLKRAPYDEDSEGYEEALMKSNIPLNQTLLIPEHEPFEQRMGNKLAYLLGFFFGGSLLWFMMILLPSIKKKELRRIKAGKPDKVAKREWREFKELLIPKEGYFYTPLLIYCNVLIYLIMVSMGLGFGYFDGRDLLEWGANNRPLIQEGEWWRLITSIFLHDGFMHLLANTSILFFVGLFLEPMLGKKIFLSAYLITGIAASLSSIWWYESTISVGSSGAILGLIGVLLALAIFVMKGSEAGRNIGLGIAIYLPFILLLGISDRIDNAAHIGGLLSGFLFGMIASYILKKRKKTSSITDNLG